MPRMFTLTAVLLALSLGTAVRVSAHPGHNHKVMGTVMAATADRVDLKDTDGKAVTVQVTKDTKVKAKSPTRVEDLKPGTRVVVTATMDKSDALRATMIEVGVVAAAPSER
jgi:hypothetical protein